MTTRLPICIFYTDNTKTLLYLKHTVVSEGNMKIESDGNEFITYSEQSRNSKLLLQEFLSTGL
jgi:hypothetical protein